MSFSSIYHCHTVTLYAVTRCIIMVLRVYYAPCLWNSLPVALPVRDISLAQFKRLLKTLWFEQGCGAQ